MFEKTAKALWSQKDPRSIRTREAMRRHFLLLLETTPLDQITLREIAAGAGIGYSTVFRHYSAKDEILREVAADELHNLFNIVNIRLDPAETRQACDAICTYVDRHRRLWKTLLTGGAAGALKEELLRVSEGTAAQRGPSTDWLPTDIGIILSVSGMIEILSWWLRQSDPLPVERVAEILDRVIIGPTVRGDF